MHVTTGIAYKYSKYLSEKNWFQLSISWQLDVMIITVIDLHYGFSMDCTNIKKNCILTVSFAGQ